MNKWSGVFPLSEKVSHKKVSFKTQYGFTEPAGKGEPKNLIPWDKLAEFFNKNLK